MAAADVVTGQGEEGAVRFRDIFGQPGVAIGQVARATEDGLLGVQAVSHAHITGCVLCQHHDATHTGWRNRPGVPMGFLVGQSREQVGRHTGLLLGLDKKLQIVRQPIGDTAIERAKVNKVKVRDVVVIVLLHQGDSVFTGRRVDPALRVAGQAALTARGIPA